MSERGLELYRRGGGVRRVATWVLVAVPMAMAATVLLGLAAHPDSAALGAAPRLEPLHGHLAAVPPGATPLGPAPSSVVLPLTVTLQPRDVAALAAEAQAVSDSASPQYHRFLTPQQFAQRYGPTQGTIAQVTATLRSEGLTVGAPSATGLSLPVSGTVAQVQSALDTPIDRYRLSSGKIGYHNRAAPQVPAAVAPQIQGILGLDTLSPPQPTTSVPAANASGSGPRALGVTPEGAPGQPEPTGSTCTMSSNNSVSNAESYGALDAPQLAQAYSFDPLYSSSDYGAGTTVALVELGGAGYSSSDISTFANCYGITPGVGQVTEKSVLGGGSGSNVEAELDIETVLSLAPKANIEVYEGGTSASMYDVVNQIETDDAAKIVSISWTNGCEAYVPSAYQSSENTLFQAAATEGQSVFVAAGDQGSEGCNVNSVTEDQTGSHPVAQVADPSTGTLYVANQSSNSVSVDSEGSSGNPSSAVTPVATVSAGSGPDAVALDSTDGKVFVANGGSSSVTALATSTCNQSTTGGCTSTATINSGLSGPTALAVNGSTLYVANSNGTVAVYNASTDAYVTSVSLPVSSSPTSLAVDASNGAVYVGDAGAVSRVDYFNATICNASVTTGCSTIPATISLPQNPVSMVVDDAAGSLYVAEGGSGGGIAVVSLSTHSLATTIATSGPGIAGTGKAQSVALSPGGAQVLAVLDGLSFPGDVLATINPTTQTIVATVNLETGGDTMGALASDGTRDYVWVTDLTTNHDVVQNLNLAVSDPASQPYVTAVGGTSLQAIGPAPTETTWNDQLHYAEGAGGGGISKTFTMPAYQQALGTVSGSSGTPCANSSGDCREVPDVSADADPSTGYVIYDSGWMAIGGTSGAAPLWAAVLSVAASADGNTDGYGAMNPILYTLAGQSPGTYLNDITTGNNDYNGTDGEQFAATSGYDMATGLGTPVTSALATGLTMIPLDVAVSGSQVYGGSPTFSATVDFAGSSSLPFGVTLSTAGLSCTEVGPSTPISPTLASGSDTLLTSSCSGVSLGGADAADYTVVYTSASGDFTVSPAPVDVAVTGSQTYGGSPVFSGAASPPSGVTVSTASLGCTEVYALTVITPTLTAGSYRLIPALCTGASLSGTDAADYKVVYTSAAGDFTVAPAALTVTASSGSMTYGSTPPAVLPTYTGFVNGDSASSLTTKPTCTTTATSSSPVVGSPYTSSCSGAADPNYVVTYAPGDMSVTGAPLTVGASSGSMTYGGTPPAVIPAYSGFVNGDTPLSLTTSPTCSTTATSSSPASPPAYPSTCSGAVDSNYAITYAAGVVTVTRAPLTVTASSGTMAYGATPPAISPTYSGFVNGDSPSSLTRVATCTTTATGASPVAGSPYASSCGGAVDPDYAFTYVPGVVSVTKVPLTVTASSPTMTYGGASPVITPAYAGFVNGDTASSLTTKPTCSTSATSASPVSGSPYSSSCTGAVDPNYALTYASGSVTVSPAPLTITASSPSMTYGSAPPAITPVYGGFKNGDVASSLTPPPTCSTTATSASPPSPPTYPSSCSGASGVNYSISDVDGATTVTPAPVDVAVVGSQAYGGSPGFTATPPPSLPSGVTGLLTSGVTCGEVVPSTAITPTLGAGTYTLVPATCGGASLNGPAAADYAVAYVPGDFSVTGGPPSPAPPAPPATHGYWLVGSDGGIFTFGSATFHGSTGNLVLQRPVVGITPTRDEGGYWLVASDGGIFAFGDAGFHGSIPGLGLHPAGSGLPSSLDAPIVGMVPSSDGGGYFMVASDGGVFAFGDAQFEGSCPGIGGCSGAAVAVVPDATGRGYWLVTQTGNIYPFGDAPYFGAPGTQGSAVTAAVRTADGGGYLVLLANGTVQGYGDAVSLGGPTGAVGGLDPASAIFTEAGGGGYWVASAAGDVFTYGGAPDDGSMAGTRLNGAIIAGTGF